jgi:GNAT superfamily N-acetyltransferase
MSGWSREDKVHEALSATMGSHFPGRDTQVIEREGWFQILTPSSKNGTCNEVIRSHLAGEEADAVIDHTLAEYRAHGLIFRWMVGPDATPSDLGARLERRGMIPSPGRAMTIEPASSVIEAIDGVSFAEVNAENFDDYGRILSEGWGVSADDERPHQIAAYCDPHRIHHMLLAYHHGVLAGAAGYIVKPRSIYLLGGVVLPNFRRRSIYRALVRERLRHARELGRTLATTQARESTSAPILERLGFETACLICTYSSRSLT